MTARTSRSSSVPSSVVLRLAISGVLLAGASPALAAGAKPAAKPATAPPTARLLVTPFEMAATADLSWNLEMRLFNDDAMGVYVDSVRCRAEDTSPGETHASRVSIFVIPATAQGFGSVSGGDSSLFNQALPARFEQGKLTFELFGHRSDGRSVAITSPTITAVPGPLSVEHPSEFLTVGGHKVEVVVLRPQAEGATPGVLVVHDHGSDARQMLPIANRLILRGYSVLLASLPGYGQSEGPADFGGARTVAALGAALDRLKREPGVDSARIGAWGIGRGAGPLASLAAKRRDLVAAVAQSGVYDFAAIARGAKPGDPMLAEAGSDTSGWAERSPIRSAAGIHTSMLVIHGEADREAPADQAHAFADALSKAGTPVETRFLPGQDHVIMRGEVQNNAIRFLDGKLKH